MMRMVHAIAAIIIVTCWKGKWPEPKNKFHILEKPNDKAITGHHKHT